MNDKNRANAQEVKAEPATITQLLAPKPLSAWTFEECAQALTNPKLTLLQLQPIVEQAKLMNAGAILAEVRKAEADVHEVFRDACDGVDFTTWLAGQSSRALANPVCDHPDGKRKLYITVNVR